MTTLVIILIALVIIWVLTAMDKKDSSKNSTEIEKQDIEKNKVYPGEELYNDNYWISVESIKRKVVTSLGIKYKKTNNEIHERIFDVSSFSRGDKGYHIEGYCHRRRKKITLSSLGVIEAIDLSSGEIIGDIKEYLEDKYRGTSSCLQDALFEDYGWALYVLIYLAAPSGSVVKKERDTIIKFIKSVPKFSSLEDNG